MKTCQALKKKLEEHPEDMTAADFQAIRAILKDSNINALATPGSPLQELEESYEEFTLPFPGNPSVLPADDLAVKRTGAS